jgi:hypothetical protein
MDPNRGYLDEPAGAACSVSSAAAIRFYLSVGGRTFENDDWRVRPWSQIENTARPT